MRKFKRNLGFLIGFMTIASIIMLSYGLTQAKVTVYNGALVLGTKTMKQWVLDEYDRMNTELAISGYQIALKDSDVDIKCHALSSLGSMGPKAHTAVPSMMPTIRDKNPEVRMRACSTLAEIVSKTSARVFPSHDMLANQERVAKEYKYKKGYVTSDFIIDQISLRLIDDDECVREVAIQSLWQIGSSNLTSFAWQGVDDARHDKSHRVREWAESIKYANPFKGY
jgi:hypothetical protein